VKRRLVVRRKAKAEIRDARDWYEDQQTGLGRAFAAEVNATMMRIEAMPLRFREVIPGVRRAMTARFPYAVYFTVDEPLVIVLAVVHMSRDPAFWQKRVDDEMTGS
jgi:toxin ParE1/3/4